MSFSQGQRLVHPRCLTRRTAIQAGSIGLLGLGMNHLNALRDVAADTNSSRAGNNSAGHSATSCIFIFLSGGLAQHESFDMKPSAPDDIRGEFRPVATSTPGIQICEHLPRLAERSHRWALCRSMTHPFNEHSQGHHVMLTGRSDLPRGFSLNEPNSSDWPSIASMVTTVSRPKNNLPPAVVLPEKLIHRSGRVLPGQFAGEMGWRRDPWFIEASPYCSTSYGAYPEFKFHHNGREPKDERVFQAPSLSLPQGLTSPRLGQRLEMLKDLDRQRGYLERHASTRSFDRYRQRAMSLLSDSKVQHALDVTRAKENIQEQYGRNAFGWSLLMARRLVEAGVSLVQVNLGNDETWDTHGNAFPHLKNKLFPPTDRAVSALIDDLAERGLLDQTLIVMAGEFGRSPKISHLSGSYKEPGRDHWGASQTVFFAGGGVRGGNVIGATDKIGAFPAENPQKPENLAATIYDSLGIPPTTAWHDEFDRPHHIYFGEPIEGLT